jgi:hypothetical protein
MTIILANGASYDLKERVVLRRLSLEMRVEVAKALTQEQRRFIRDADYLVYCPCGPSVLKGIGPLIFASICFISLFFFQRVVRCPPFPIAAL